MDKSFDVCNVCDETIQKGKCNCIELIVDCPVCCNAGELHCQRCLGDGCKVCVNGYTICNYCNGLHKI